MLFSYLALIFDPEPSRLQLITPQVLILSLGQSIGTVAAIFASILMGIAGIVLLRLRPLTGFGILFFMLGLAPESVLVPQYLFVIYRASLPMFGLILVLSGHHICLSSADSRPTVGQHCKDLCHRVSRSNRGSTKRDNLFQG